MQLAAVLGFQRAGVAVIGGFADHRTTAGAVGAAAAGADQRDHDAIPDRDAAYPVAHSGHPSRGLVTIDRGQRSAPAAAGKRNVRMADRYGIQRHLDLGPLGGAEFYVFDFQGSTKFMANGGFDQRHNGSFRAREFRGGWQALPRPASLYAPRWLRLTLCQSTCAGFIRTRRKTTKATTDRIIDSTKGAPAK